MTRKKTGNDGAMIGGLLALSAALSLAVLVLPGREGLEFRVSLLVMPWGAVASGFGLLWLTRRPHLEGAVGKVLLGLAGLVTVGVLAGVALS